VILAAENVDSTGVLVTDGADGLAAGSIEMRAGPTSRLAATLLVAAGPWGGGGGIPSSRIVATLSGNATIDSARSSSAAMRAPSIQRKRDRRPCWQPFRAGSVAGAAGSVLIGRQHQLVPTEYSGANLTRGGNNVTVTPGVTVRREIGRRRSGDLPPSELG
jgi:hypothetical protein